MATNKPEVIWLDLDGTACIRHEGRSVYEFATCDQDLPNEPVVKAVRALARVYPIIVMTGRERRFQPQCEKWLSCYKIPYLAINMRQDGDKRGDDIVKAELYKLHVEPFYEVVFCLDDRDRVVKMSRETLGLTVFQVQPGNF